VTGASLHQILEPVNPLKGAIFEYVLVNIEQFLKIFFKDYCIPSWKQLMIMKKHLFKTSTNMVAIKSVAIRPE
jgi:hypothetical protein